MAHMKAPKLELTANRPLGGTHRDKLGPVGTRVHSWLPKVWVPSLSNRAHCSVPWRTDYGHTVLSPSHPLPLPPCRLLKDLPLARTHLGTASVECRRVLSCPTTGLGSLKKLLLGDKASSLIASEIIAAVPGVSRGLGMGPAGSWAGPCGGAGHGPAGGVGMNPAGGG